MSQTDGFHIPNLAGAPFRNLLNQILAALSDQNAGSTEPANPFAGMVWLDTSTSNPIFKLRNAANTGWVKIFTAEHPPTKAQVGLGNVPNYSATSSLSDGSASKLLLAVAGKTLQDNKLGQNRTGLRQCPPGQQAGEPVRTDHRHLPQPAGTGHHQGRRRAGQCPELRHHQQSDQQQRQPVPVRQRRLRPEPDEGQQDDYGQRQAIKHQYHPDRCKRRGASGLWWQPGRPP